MASDYIESAQDTQKRVDRLWEEKSKQRQADCARCGGSGWVELDHMRNARCTCHLPAKSDLLQAKVEVLEEDIESVHTWLDDQGAPREDEGGTLSLVGRIKTLFLASTGLRQLEKRLANLGR